MEAENFRVKKHSEILSISLPVSLSFQLPSELQFSPLLQFLFFA